MIKDKISDNIYRIYVDRYPDTVDVEVYRGDFFSFTIIGLNFDDTPWDFSMYDTFRAQLRLGDPRNEEILYEFPEDSFILGRSMEDSQIEDELHLIDFENEAVSMNVDTWLDIQGLIGKERKTFIKVRLIVEPDVTRIE